jgi:hypothetical protein
MKEIPHDRAVSNVAGIAMTDEENAGAVFERNVPAMKANAVTGCESW